MNKGRLVKRAAGEHAFDAGKHFVQVLAENGRLGVLPEVSAQFEILRLQLKPLPLPMLNRQWK